MRADSLLGGLPTCLLGVIALLMPAIASAAAISDGAAPPAAPRIDTSPVPFADPGSALAEGWQHGAFIEIFVRAYKDSDGDGIGDLRGLIQSLDYLHDLGVRGIWLMPVTRSQDRDHGYAVVDYRDIEPDYGDLEDFDELLKQAHARGIGVIMDYVINHSAAGNPLFTEASSSPGSRYRSWYVWRDVAPTDWNIMGKNPWITTPAGSYLAQFSPWMPDFDMRNPEVMAFHKDNLRFWLNRGVDGFRFDAVGHLLENGPDEWSDQPGDYALMNEVRALVHSYSQRYMVCEAPPNPEAFASPDACGGAFLIFGARVLMDAARGQEISIAGVANYFSAAPAGIATILSSHDLFAGDRPWNQLGGESATYRLAAATYLLLPGTPFIYYGEEIGMASAADLQGDPKLRTPMSWTGDRTNAGFTSGKPFRPLSANVERQNVESERGRKDSLLAHYRSLIGLRNRYPSIARGSYESPVVAGKVMSYQRRHGGENALVVINYGKHPAKVHVRGLPTAREVEQVFPSGTGGRLAVDAQGASEVAIGAQSVLVFVSNPAH